MGQEQIFPRNQAGLSLCLHTRRGQNNNSLKLGGDTESEADLAHTVHRHYHNPVGIVCALELRVREANPLLKSQIPSQPPRDRCVNPLMDQRMRSCAHIY